MTVLRRRKLPYDAEAARGHLLRADPVLREIVERVGPYRLELRGGPYRTLLRAILYQQLAGPAAAAIERRFLALFGGDLPSPEKLLAKGPDELRTAGISRQKAGYFHSLAEHFGPGGLTNRRLYRASDDEIIELVTKVRGVGRWTTDMLLMFCLGRPDVLPVGDLGVQRVMREAYRLDSPPDSATMVKIAEPWRPYRSAGAWYLWRSTDIITQDVTL